MVTGGKSVYCRELMTVVNMSNGGIGCSSHKPDSSVLPNYVRWGFTMCVSENVRLITFQLLMATSQPTSDYIACSRQLPKCTGGRKRVTVIFSKCLTHVANVNLNLELTLAQSIS